MAAHVGLDPRKDIDWVENPAAEAIRPYARWREYDAADTVRFYALRLNEVGFIKSSPQRILTQGTDWRFLNEIKKELKG